MKKIGVFCIVVTLFLCQSLSLMAMVSRPSVRSLPLLVMPPTPNPQPSLAGLGMTPTPSPHFETKEAETIIPGNIYTIENFDTLSCAIELAVHENPEETLIVVDIDETLLRHTSALARSDALTDLWIKYCMQEGVSPLQSLFTKHEYIMLARDPMVLVHDQLSVFIKGLQKRNIKVIALTARNSAKDFRALTLQQLTAVDINLDSAFPSISSTEGPVIFQKGVLYSNRDASKGKGWTLVHFLHEIAHWAPEKIVFIDDLKPYIDFVIQSCMKQADPLSAQYFPCIGLNYIDSFKHFPVILDENVIQFQLLCLIRSGTWINDQQARHLLRQNQPNDKALPNVSALKI